MSEINTSPPREQWQGPGEDRRRPSSVSTAYRGEERRAMASESTPPNRRRSYTGPERRRSLLDSHGGQPAGDGGREAALEHQVKRRRAAEREADVISKVKRTP